MSKKTPKPRADEMYVSILRFFAHTGRLVDVGDRLRGDAPEVRVYPQFFVSEASGADGLEAASRAFYEDVQLANANREARWARERGEKPAAPTPRYVRVRAPFVHNGLPIEKGERLSTSHEAVRIAGVDCFDPDEGE